MWLVAIISCHALQDVVKVLDSFLAVAVCVSRSPWLCSPQGVVVPWQRCEATTSTVCLLIIPLLLVVLD